MEGKTTGTAGVPSVLGVVAGVKDAEHARHSRCGALLPGKARQSSTRENVPAPCTARRDVSRYARVVLIGACIAAALAVAVPALAAVRDRIAVYRPATGAG